MAAQQQPVSPQPPEDDNPYDGTVPGHRLTDLQIMQQAESGRGLLGRLKARLGQGAPLTELERAAVQQATDQGLGFLGTGIGAIRGMQQDIADTTLQGRREMTAKEAEEQKQLSLMQLDKDNFIRMDDGRLFDIGQRQFITDQDYVERQAQQQAEKQSASSGGGAPSLIYSDSTQYRHPDHGLVTSAFNRTTGNTEIRDQQGNLLTVDDPEKLRPTNSAGRQALEKQSVSRFGEFTERMSKNAPVYQENLATIETIKNSPEAFGSTPADFIGRLISQYTGSPYQNLTAEERSALDARFKKSQLQTVQDFLAGTGPVTEAEQAVAKGFAGTFKMEPGALIQLFELQNYMHEKDQRMRQDFISQNVMPEDFDQWRLQWTQDNENIEGLRAILDPKRYDNLLKPSTTTVPDEQGFLKANGLSYRIVK